MLLVRIDGSVTPAGSFSLKPSLKPKCSVGMASAFVLYEVFSAFRCTICIICYHVRGCRPLYSSFFTVLLQTTAIRRFMHPFRCYREVYGRSLRAAPFSCQENSFLVVRIDAFDLLNRAFVPCTLYTSHSRIIFQAMLIDHASTRGSALHGAEVSLRFQQETIFCLTVLVYHFFISP